MAEAIKCPDCNKEAKEVIVEKWQTRKFTVDYENHLLVPIEGEDWQDSGDSAIRCAACDTLNMDSVFNGFTIKGGES
jgi:phage FluMu protein Com